MARTSLVPFTRIREIINSLSEAEIVQYDGAVCTQKSSIGSSGDEISIVEVKLAFVRKEEADKIPEGQQASAQH